MLKDIMLLISAAAAAVSITVCQTRQLHMLQLNSYFASRYLGWVKTAFSYRLVFSVFSYAVSMSFLFSGAANYIPLMIFTVISCIIRCAFVLFGAKAAKKKLVVTQRVQRMYLTAQLLALVPLILMFLKISGKWSVFALLTALFGAPIYTLAVLFINKPMEHQISLHFIRDAKRILKASKNMTVIGITGSYGKTSTKFILGRMLSEKYSVTVTPESFNTLLGVVRTIREKLTPGTQIFVCEMGAKNIGDIKEICGLVHPHHGIITAVGPQHLSTFKSVHNVTKTKFELADEVTKNGGIIYLNADNEYIRNNKDSYKHVTYGTENSAAMCRAENIKSGRFGSSFDITRGDRRISVETKLLGQHNILNILAAASISIDFGLSDTEIKFAVSQLAPTPHRLEMKPFMNGAILIDDAYNANPGGSLEAMRVLGTFDGYQKIAVTPGLVELGSEEYQHNYNLGLAIAEHCDIAILVGKKRAVPMADAIKTTEFNLENLHISETFTDALALMQKMVNKDTVVLFENDLPDNYAG